MQGNHTHTHTHTHTSNIYRWKWRRMKRYLKSCLYIHSCLLWALFLWWKFSAEKLQTHRLDCSTLMKTNLSLSDKVTAIFVGNGSLLLSDTSNTADLARKSRMHNFPEIYHKTMLAAKCFQTCTWKPECVWCLLSGNKNNWQALNIWGWESSTSHCGQWSSPSSPYT